MDNKKLTIQQIIFDFLKEKFPFQTIEYEYYSPIGPQPGDYKAPSFKINGHIIGYLTDDTTFVKFFRDFETINTYEPDFLDNLHKMTVHTLGYDPLIPGSREEFMNS